MDLDLLEKFVRDNTIAVIIALLVTVFLVIVFKRILELQKVFVATKQRQKELRASGQGKQAVTFTGTKGMTTVTYSDLEIVQDPQTGEKFGAGENFEKDYLEQMRNPPSPVGGLGGSKTCELCKKKLPPEPHPDVLEKTYQFTGMKPFTIKIEAPMYVCEGCGAKNLADIDEWIESDGIAQENAKLTVNI